MTSNSLAAATDDRGSASAADNPSSGTLDLEFQRRGDRTALVRMNQRGRLGAGRPYRERDGSVTSIIRHVGPGLLSGDQISLSCALGEGTKVNLTGQGATRVHSASGPEPAESTIRIRCESGARLLALWDPVIPFAGSRFRQSAEIDLSRHARAIWMETICAGRIASNEAFAFVEISTRLMWRVAGRLVCAECQSLTPDRARSPVAWAGLPFLTTICIYEKSLTEVDIDGFLRDRTARSDEPPVAISNPSPGFVIIRSAGTTRRASEASPLEAADWFHRRLDGAPPPLSRKY